MNRKILAAVLIGLMCTTTSYAASFGCYGKVTSLLTYANGGVNIRSSWRSNYTFICNLNAEWKGISPTTCAMWVGLVSSAMTDNANVQTYYTSPDDEFTCATMDIYGAAPPPVYVGKSAPPQE